MSFSSISTVSYIDELGHHDDNARLAQTMENTYQMGELAFLIAYKTGVMFQVLGITELTNKLNIFFLIILSRKVKIQPHSSIEWPTVLCRI